MRDILQLGLGGESWQSFVDHYEEKFNARSIDGFDFDPISISYTFSQLLAQVGASVLPTYVDPESEGYEMPLASAEGVSGNIPTQKLFYSVNRVIVREQMQLAQRFGTAAMNEDMRDVIFKLLDEGTDGLIDAFWNALKHQRDQIVSTGEFSINATNNPRGIKGLTIGFGILAEQKDTLTGTASWWTDAAHTTEGSKSDPVKYVRDRVKFIRRGAKWKYAGPLRLELTQDLLDDVLTHSKVLAAIGYQVAPSSGTDAAAQAVGANVSDEQKLDILRRLWRVEEVVPRESYSYVSKPGVDASGAPDLVTEQIDNFNKKNIAIVPTGKLGSIQGVKPLSMGYDPENVAYSMGGRLLIEQEGIPRTHSINVNGEMAQLCVPSAIRHMLISTVTE